LTGYGSVYGSTPSSESDPESTLERPVSDPESSLRFSMISGVALNDRLIAVGVRDVR
jgi:hypothetical protein